MAEYSSVRISGNIVLMLLVFLFSFGSLRAGLGDSPYDDDPFKAYYKRQFAALELVFTYESNDNRGESISGTAFIAKIYNRPYIVTNLHVLNSIIIEGHKTLELTNGFGRKLLIESPYYLQLMDINVDEGFEGEPLEHPDLVLIPYAADKFYYAMDPFSLSRDIPKVGLSAHTYGNTMGQGFISPKECLVNIVGKYLIGYMSAARSGNSGGPILDLYNNVIGVHTAGTGQKLADRALDQKRGIRLDAHTVGEWYDDGRFELKAFPKDVWHYYTEETATIMIPEEHHSRDKSTPHLSMGLSVGSIDDEDVFDMESLERVWDMKRRSSHRPLKCFNFDVLPLDRQLRLCATYGQTMSEFIPKEWFRTYFNEHIIRASKMLRKIEASYLFAIQSIPSIQAEEDRETKIEAAKELKVFEAMRCVFNARVETNRKMLNNGEIFDTAILISQFE